MKKPSKGAPGVIKIKKAGWIYIALCIFMGVGAVNTANNLVYIIVAIMLGFMAVSGFFGAADMNRLRIEIGFPDEIYAGQTFPVSVRLINGRRFLPAFLIRVHLGGGDILFPFVDTGAESVRFAELKLDERGRAVVDNIYISTVFPFNFFIRYKDLNDKFDVVVFPAPAVCSMLQPKGEGNGDENSSTKGFESELVAVRSYAAGDSMRLIHWKATARTGTLKVKEFAPAGAEPVVIELDGLGGDLETRLSCAAGLIKELNAKGSPIGLRTAKAFYQPDVSETHKLAMLRELALYD